MFFCWCAALMMQMHDSDVMFFNIFLNIFLTFEIFTCTTILEQCSTFRWRRVPLFLDVCSAIFGRSASIRTQPPPACLQHTFSSVHRQYASRQRAKLHKQKSHLLLNITKDSTCFWTLREGFLSLQRDCRM